MIKYYKNSVKIQYTLPFENWTIWVSGSVDFETKGLDIDLTCHNLGF